MDIKNQKEYFNETYESWKEVSNEKSRIVNKTINKLGISEGDSFLDVASGTGVFYAVLKQLSLNNYYVALDISENMLAELKSLYPEATTICGDFDKEIRLEDKFDYIIIFNSIPHFENLDMVFSNASRHLKVEGVFAIVHSRTREGLKQHHKNIGYSLGRDAIPSDITLYELVERYEFKDCVVTDEDFFYFSCKK
ncbi:MAG: class I SAM-dependent methyltransferase [Bacillota bacterium]|nr:class I SAM-dependent methyltransferase [Bacillota bacterium]